MITTMRSWLVGGVYTAIFNIVAINARFLSTHVIGGRMVAKTKAGGLQILCTHSGTDDHCNELFHIEEESRNRKNFKSTRLYLDYLFQQNSTFPSDSHLKDCIDYLAKTELTSDICNSLLMKSVRANKIDLLSVIASSFHEVLNYNSLLILTKRFGEIGRMELVEQYYNMKSVILERSTADQRPSAVQLSALNNIYLKTLLSSGKELQAMQLCAQWKTSGEADLYTFNTFLSYYDRKKSYDRAIAIWEELTQMQMMNPTAATSEGWMIAASLAIKAFVLSGKVDSARRLLESSPSAMTAKSWVYSLAVAGTPPEETAREIDLCLLTLRDKDPSFLIPAPLNAAISGYKDSALPPVRRAEALLTLLQWIARRSGNTSISSPSFQQELHSLPLFNPSASPPLATSPLILHPSHVADLEPKSFNIVLNAFKALAGLASEHALSWRALSNTSSSAALRGSQRVHSSLREVQQHLSQLAVLRIQWNLHDDYSHVTAMEFANAWKDFKLARFVWESRVRVRLETAAKARLLESFLRAHRSPVQFASLEELVHQNLAGVQLQLQPPQSSSREEEKNSSAERVWKAWRKPLVSARCADEWVNACLRVGGFHCAVSIAESLFAEKCIRLPTDDLRHRDSGTGSGTGSRASVDRKIPLESSLLNLAISFDRHWRDYDSEDSIKKGGRLVFDHRDLVDEAQRLTTILVTSRRYESSFNQKNERNRGSNRAAAAQGRPLSKELSIWAAVLSALLSRGKWNEAIALLEKMETGHVYNQPPASGRVKTSLYSAREISSCLEWAVMGALDGSLPMLTEGATSLVAELLTQRQWGVSLSRLLQVQPDPTRTGRLAFGDKRTVSSLSDMIEFLQLLEKNDEVEMEGPGGWSHGKGRYSGPIGVSLLESVFYECVERRQLASARKVLRLLEHCRLVVDVSKPLRLLQSLPYLGGDGAYEQVDLWDDHAVRVYLARRWTALLLGQSLNSFRARVLTDSIRCIARGGSNPDTAFPSVDTNQSGLTLSPCLELVDHS